MGVGKSKLVIPDREELTALIQDGKRKPRTVTLTVENLLRLKDRGVDLTDVPATVSELNAAMKRSTVATYMTAVVNLLAAAEKEGTIPRAKELLAAYRQAELSEYRHRGPVW